MATIALAWVLQNPVVDTPIVGATGQHHLTDTVAALDIDLRRMNSLPLRRPTCAEHRRTSEPELGRTAAHMTRTHLPDARTLKASYRRKSAGAGWR